MADFRRIFEPHLVEALEDRLSRFADIAQDDFLTSLSKGLPPLLAGGKRLRPYLAQVGYHLGEGDDVSALMRLGVGLEFFHVFCLIHDDIIDKAQVRRGVPTMEIVARDAFVSQKRRGDVLHLAQGQAMLFGDLLYAWALECITSSALGKSQAHLVYQHFFSMIDEVVIGQMIDVDTMTRDVYDMALLERKMYLKTASYSFVRPMLLGLALSGAYTSALDQAIRAFAEPLGIAFQIQDDLFDVTKSTSEIGKPVLADIRDGQQTLLTAHMALSEHELYRNALRLALEGDQQAIDALPEMFSRSGAVAFAENRVTVLLQASEHAIAQLPTSVHEYCFDLIASLRQRSS